MDFIAYVKGLPNYRIDEIKMIADLTMTSTATVRRWINGKIAIPPIKKKIIAEHYGKTIEELFPECE